MQSSGNFSAGSILLLALLGNCLLPLANSGPFTTSRDIAMCWGQNSKGASDGSLAEQDLVDYCADTDIDIVIIALLVQLSTGTGGQPVFNLANSQNNCTLFDGTSLLDCPSVGDDIRQCQEKYGKKVFLSIGGATYTEGGFESPDAANSGAQLVWDTFGPTQGSVSNVCNGTSGSNHSCQAQVLRPFGNASVDGFDFDFESTTQNLVPFARTLRSLMDQDASKRYYLTAAPQCPYPDLAGESLLRSDIYLDAVFVQFYNNYYGLPSFSPNATT